MYHDPGVMYQVCTITVSLKGGASRLIR